MEENVYLEVTFKRAFIVFCEAVWRIFVLFILIVFGGTIAMELFLYLLGIVGGVRLVNILTIFCCFLMIAFFLISIKIMQLVLKKNFGEFRIALIKIIN